MPGGLGGVMRLCPRRCVMPQFLPVVRSLLETDLYKFTM